MNTGMVSQTRRQSVLYAVWLFVAWTIYVAFVYPAFPTPPSVPVAVVQEGIRGLIFLLPLAVLLRGKRLWEWLRGNTLTRRTIGVGLMLGVAWATVSVGLAVYGQHRTLSGLPPAIFWVSGFTLATVVEELTFRGYFTRVLSTCGTWVAVIGSSLLFVGIHIPGWILLDIPGTWKAGVAMSLSIFALGCLLAAVFLKTESIWPCILLHAFNNLAAALVT